ncbi:MAG: iron-sulfur cluster assembly scaffold protein [Thermoplasmata archaeon]|nr:iron-sulfur cluster assembly scaffold protein [Thermoplasmata archaeon]
MIKLYLKIDPCTEIIENATFESYGCAANIATSSMLTELIKGKSVEEARKIAFQEVVDDLGEFMEEIVSNIMEVFGTLPVKVRIFVGDEEVAL